MSAVKTRRPKAAVQGEWIRSSEAVKLLGRGPRGPYRAAAKGLIRRHKVVGMAPLYSKADILALLPPQT